MKNDGVNPEEKDLFGNPIERTPREQIHARLNFIRNAVRAQGVPTVEQVIGVTDFEKGLDILNLEIGRIYAIQTDDGIQLNFKVISTMDGIYKPAVIEIDGGDKYLDMFGRSTVQATLNGSSTGRGIGMISRIINLGWFLELSVIGVEKSIPFRESFLRPSYKLFYGPINCILSISGVSETPRSYSVDNGSENLIPLQEELPLNLPGVEVYIRSQYKSLITLEKLKESLNTLYTSGYLIGSQYTGANRRIYKNTHYPINNKTNQRFGTVGEFINYYISKPDPEEFDVCRAYALTLWALWLDRLDKDEE